ncbi:MAG: branched-chain amino acid aminotransferase [Gammaproteobacteria bacterium]
MTKAFGSIFTGHMTVSAYRDGAWSPVDLRPLDMLDLHPAAHVLHYASTCFEGLKAYRRKDGGVHIFRLDSHVARMRHSARLLCLPVPESTLIEDIVCRLVDACRAEVPAAPGALYLRPVLAGVDPNIGGASKPANEALLYAIASPVGDYFGSSRTPLRLLVENCMRTTPEFGQVKTGGNYAAALGRVAAAKQNLKADQVLFCPGGDVQETGAANFILLREDALLTKPLDGSILPGVTRDSLLRLAEREGYRVEERDFDIQEMLQWTSGGEAALSGTAAVLAGVGVLLHGGREHRVGDGQVGTQTTRLRSLLTAIQTGEAADEFGWLRSL